MLGGPVRAVNDERRRAGDKIVAIAGEHILARRIEKYPAEGPLDGVLLHDDEIMMAGKLGGRFSGDFKRLRVVDGLVDVLWFDHKK